jgi:uncharacterized protein YndB with AHSA1/START domain
MIKLKSFDIQIGQTIDAAPASVWHLLTDTRYWSQWGPSITAVECDDRIIRSGSRGRVKTRLGFWLPFVVSDFEPGSYWRWHVGGIRATGHRVEPLASARCRLSFDIPIFAAPYSGICWLALQRIARLLTP